METKIIKIGNSKGIIIPSKVLQKMGDGFEEGDDIEITVHMNQVILTPMKNPRDGWEEKFIKANEIEKKCPHCLNIPCNNSTEQCSDSVHMNKLRDDEDF